MCADKTHSMASVWSQVEEHWHKEKERTAEMTRRLGQLAAEVGAAPTALTGEWDVECPKCRATTSITVELVRGSHVSRHDMTMLKCPCTKFIREFVEAGLNKDDA